MEKLGDAYECEITDPEGIQVDETAHIKLLYQSNFYLYLCLTIACFFSCIGGPVPYCRYFSGCCHCVGAFAHIGVLVYTGLVRFKWAKDCFGDSEEGSGAVSKELKEDGQFIKNAFIAQCVLYCVFSIAANVG